MPGDRSLDDSLQEEPFGARGVTPRRLEDLVHLEEERFREQRARLREPIEKLVAAGFRVVATRGTAQALQAMGIAAEVVNKVHEGSPHTADKIAAGEIALVINTVGPGPRAAEDSKSLRRAALLRRVPYCTTLAAARASADAILALRAERIGVRSLQQIHELDARAAGRQVLSMPGATKLGA